MEVVPCIKLDDIVSFIIVGKGFKGLVKWPRQSDLQALGSISPFKLSHVRYKVNPEF